MGTLTVLALVPLIGSLVVAFGSGQSAARAKQIALFFAVVTFGVGVYAITQYDVSSSATYQLVESHEWIPSLGLTYSVGVDGLALVLVFLATLLVPLVIIAGWNDVEDTAGLPTTDEQKRGSVRGYFALVLLLETMMIGVFVALDVFLFYFLFEAILIPVYFMIGRYGTGRRTYASVKFLIYSLAGGLVMLAALVMLWFVASEALGSPTLYLPELIGMDMDPVLENLMFWGFFLAFAIKAPLWPLHTWLPDAAGSATPGTAVLLIGVLDKIGTYGMLRLCLPLFPEASQTYAPIIIAVSVIGIFYGALAAIGQTDMKRLFGYVSISHFGFITLGIFVFTSQGQVGAGLYMLGHGLSTALLFMVAGYMIVRRKSANVADYGGVVKPAPVLAGMFLIAGLTALALPGLSTFVSEFLVLLGAFTVNPWLGAGATLGIIFAALYVLLLYQRTMTGPETEQVRGMPDLNLRERWVLAPIIGLVVFLGFYPAPVLDVLEPAVANTMEWTGTADPDTEMSPVAEGSQP
jgi:NADH-quinone oxidoreductase subunit M